MDFLTRYKKILIAAAFIATVFILGYLLFILFFKPADTLPKKIENNATSSGTGLPSSEEGSAQIVPDNTSEKNGQIEVEKTAPSPIADGGLTQTQEVIASANLGSTLGKDGNLQFYNKEDGKFYLLDEDGEAKPLSEKIFHKVSNVTWSPNKNNAILEYPDGAKTIYDFGSDKQISLPSHWKDFSYSPDGNNIVLKSIGQNQDNRWLAIINSDGSNVRGIEFLGDSDETVYSDWSPNNQIISMFTEGKDLNRQEVYFVGLNQENFKSTIIEGRGFQPQWSPQGDKLLYSVYSTDTELKPGLWVVDAQGDNIGTNRKQLDIQTWADKCSFAGANELYCAVPEKLQEGAGLFPALAKETKDSLYKVDTSTGSKKLIAIPDGDYTISNILISKDKKNLYFNDQKEKLYKINLK